MIKEFPLPDLGEGLTESEIVAWRVAVGDHVELNQIIADVETAKAVVELPSPYAGVITALHAAEGETVNVGEPLFSCDTGEGAVATLAEPVDASERRRSLRRTQGAMFRMPHRAPTSSATARVMRAVRSAAHAGRRSSADLVPPAPVEDSRRIRRDRPQDRRTGASAFDAARAQARPRPRHRPRRRRGHGGARAHHAAPTWRLRHPGRSCGSRRPRAVSRLRLRLRTSDADRPAETRVPIKGVRKHTAAAMVRSAFTAPHVTEFLTIDVTATMELLRGIRENRAFAGHKVTPLTVVAKAVCIAARRTPEVNSRWDEEAQEIVQFGGVNLGIAAATGRGLVVPNVKGAERMTLIELADAIAALAETARAGRTGPADLTGGTISITNIGVFGIDAGTPILNPGEAAILAMGAVRRQPWEHRGEIALREMMTLSLSFDHRLVDGEQGSQVPGRHRGDPPRARSRADHGVRH